MSYDVDTFLAAAMGIGLGARLAALTADVDMASAEFPPGPDRRHLARLENQRDRLQSPDLALIAALVERLCDEEPRRWKAILPVVRQLGDRNPTLARLGQRGAQAEAITAE